MYFSSGIGVYLQNLVPRIAQIIPAEDLILLGSAAVLEQLTKEVPEARLRETKSRIYTVAEQVELIRAYRLGAMWWSPHFNIPLFYRGPLVVTVHDLYHLASPEIRRNPIKLAYAQAMFRTIRRRASKVICVSHFTAREFERLVGCRPGQIEVIHNGVDECWFAPVSGLRPQVNPYFLFVGNLKPNKNVHGLIQAFSEISTCIPHDLVIVGHRSAFLTLDRKAEALAAIVGSRVKFTGFVQFAELRRWYRHAAALVFPSLYEGFGFPPLEAMAVQCPVITSNVASLPEICGGAALYCDPEDIFSIARAMLRITEDHGLRQQLVNEGAHRVREYRWADAAAQTGAVLQSVA